MKKALILMSSLLFLFCFSISVVAHPGSLDSNGGHWNHKTGEYHYHNGDNNDVTSSGKLEHTYNYDRHYNPNNFNNTNSKSPSQQETTRTRTVTVALIIIASVVLGLTATFLVLRFRDKAPYHWCEYVPQGLYVGKDIDEGKHIFYPKSSKQGNLVIVKQGIIKKNILITSKKIVKLKKNENIFLYNCTTVNLKTPLQALEIPTYSIGNEPKEQFIKKYSGAFIDSVIDVPSPISHIDTHGNIIYTDKSSAYGGYTVYVSDTGKVIHRCEGCSNAFKSLNILRLPYKYSIDSRCKRCFPNFNPALIEHNWMPVYRRIVLRKIEYNIDETLSNFNEFVYFSYEENQYIKMQKSKSCDKDNTYIMGTDLPLSINRFFPDDYTKPSFVRIYTENEKSFYDFIVTNNTMRINCSKGRKIELINCSIKWGD